ncbi:VanZ family protein [Carnobacterium viridans]|uniref:VanZ like family protein n=1 Tax=Carnobacterium viridans TaxID=174587 RepID=A0A1H0YCR7_9LACT|nr:VanZ family protein [Carnobacterium viridans]UDE95205.1 VanZ family protein [Carnobacterium viridans]SDQ12968.1 VanZ like family protein [Carnobacterium viridans]
MKVENRRPTKIFPWLIVLGWMSLIFYFSHQVQQQSWDLSHTVLGISIQVIKVTQVIVVIGLAGFAIVKLKKRGVTIGIKELLLIFLVGYFVYSLSIGVRQALVPPDLHHFIRKNAHFFIYLILGVLVKYALNSTGVSEFKSVTISLLICVAYAFSDEIHQLVVPGRGGQLSDVVIDSYGAGLGILLQLTFVKFISKKALNQKTLETKVAE